MKEICLLVIRAGVWMHPRAEGKRPEQARKDFSVLALPTVCPDGKKGWSFLRGGDARQKWYVEGEDVTANDLRELPQKRKS